MRFVLLLLVISVIIPAAHANEVNCVPKVENSILKNVFSDGVNVTVNWKSGDSATYEIENHYTTGYGNVYKRVEAVYLQGNSPSSLSLDQYQYLSLQHPSSRYFGVEGELAIRKSYFGTIGGYYRLNCSIN